MEFNPDQLNELRTKSVLKRINMMAKRLQKKYTKKVVYRIHVCKDNEAVITQFGTSQNPNLSATEYKKLNSSIEWRCLNLQHLDDLKEKNKLDLSITPVPLLHDYAVINRQALIGYNLQTERIVSFECDKSSVTAVEYLALFDNIEEFTERDILWTWRKIGLNPHNKKHDSSCAHRADEQTKTDNAHRRLTC